MPLIDSRRAVQLLRQGEVVAIPTETVYGLAGRIDDEASLRRIFAIKQRPFFDPLIVHVSSLAQARSLAREWPPILEALALKLWPGPLTLVTPKVDAVSSLITSGLDSVALRWPGHPVADQILRDLGVALAAPSANRFGRTSPTTAAHVESEFDGTVAIVDGGPCAVGLESTVLQVEPHPRDGGAWRLNLLRPGGVSRAQIQNALGREFKIEFARVASAASPGNLKAHYQPANPVVLLDAGYPDVRARVEHALGITAQNIFHLQLPTDISLAARLLYGELRRLSAKPGVIVVEATPDNSGAAWEALWDRLERASSADLRSPRLD